VRVFIYYALFAWVVLQVGDLLLEAFELSHLMRFLVAGIVVGFPVVLALSWMFDITPSGLERTQPLPEAVAAPAGSLAVLPFDNLSGDAENEYFSDGLSEEIRNQLADTPGLKVAARTSSFAFKGRHEDVREIGRRLNVAAILEGGVRKQAGIVRISLQLVSTGDGFQLWSERFERRLEDIFGLQREIAAAVTRIVAPMSVAGPRTTQESAPRSFEAYNLYLRGRHHFHKRTQAALRRAVDYFEQAIALDPDYARAWAGLSDAWILLSSRYYGNLSSTETVARALPAARRALELDPALAEAHASLGLVAENSSDLEAADGSLRRALQLNPGYSMALVWYGLVLVQQGRFREAAQRNREALQLDPLSPIINVNVGFDALRAGDIEGALANFGAAVDIDPGFPVSHYGMARAHSLAGQFDAARREIDEAIRYAPGRAYYYAQKSLVLLQAGDTEAAAQAVEEACDLSPDNPLDADLVVAHYMVGDRRDELGQIARGETRRDFGAGPRAQAFIALGDLDAAQALYDSVELERRRELLKLVTDDWVWRLPHVINRAHLRLLQGDGGGRAELEALLGDLQEIREQGVRNPMVEYWAATACNLLGRQSEGRERLAEARAAGWRHDWWLALDWNAQALD